MFYISFAVVFGLLVLERTLDCSSGYSQLDTLEMRRELEPKCVPQLLLGSLLGTRRSVIGQFFSLSLAVPEVFAKVNSAQFPSRMADCSHTAGEDAMRYITLPTHLLQVLYTFYSRHHQGPALGRVFSAETSRYQWCLQQTGKLIWKRISAVRLSHLVELIIASSRCLFQLVLHNNNNNKITNEKEKKSYLSSAWVLPVSLSFPQNLLNPPTC